MDRIPKIIVAVMAMAFAACTVGSPGTGTSANRPESPSLSGNTKVWRLKIGRVASVPLSNSEADRILAGATRVLRDHDSNSDVGADVVLQRSGDVRVIDGPAVINSDADRARIGASGVQIAVVEAVRYCSAMKPGILGCAPIGGNYMVLVRQNLLEDIIWAHEFGHNCGLNHRNDRSALMYTEAGSNRRSLNLAEARTYQTRRASSGSAAIMSGTEPAPTSAEEFLDRIYIHGIPFSQVSRFGGADAEKFKAVLADPMRKRQWRNASVALGAIGTPEAVEGVCAFVCAGIGQLDHESYQAKLAAVVSLGYGASRKVHAPALDQLAKLTSVDHLKREVRWRAPGRGAGESTVQMLADASFSALALSGKPEAADLLTAAARNNENIPALHERAKAALIQLDMRRKKGTQP